MKTKKNYKAYIAGNKETNAFDSAYGQTEKSATSAIKRRNSPDWENCAVWCVYVHTNGDEERLY